MLRIGKNNLPQWELLLKVLSGDIPDTDSAFQHWLEEDPENKKIYYSLKGGVQQTGIPFDKDKTFNNISNILGLKIRSKKPFYRKNWFTYAASLLAIVSVGLISYFLFVNDPTPEQAEYSEIGRNVFDPGSKKAYLLSAQGESIDLSESFELKSNDGAIISNKSEGVVRFQQGESSKKTMEYHTIYVPKGGEYELLLADGSKVYLNSETRLIFPHSFDDSTRQVELIGEAYFEVKKATKPFIVKTNDMQIEVLGTSFNVSAYTENLSAHATLVEGSVQVQIPNNPETYLLSPANNLNVDKTTKKISTRNVDTNLYTAWVKGKFIFRNQSLNEIFTQLQRWYDFEIVYKDPAIQALRFTGSAEKTRPLDYLLNQIQSVTNVKYKNEGDKIILY